jgi:hypothetical protein
MDDSRVRKVSDLLGSILSPAMAAQADEWSSFHDFWNKAAGENLAAHSRPADVRNGIVFIEAEHPGWIQLLQMDQDRILDAIVKKFPALGICGIAFRLAKDGSLPGTARKTFPAGNRAFNGQNEDGGADPGIGVSSDVRAETDGMADTGDVITVNARIPPEVHDASFQAILSSLADTLATDARPDAVKGRRPGNRPGTRPVAGGPGTPGKPAKPEKPA